MPLAQILLSNMPPLALCAIMMGAAAILSVAGTLIFHRFIPHRSLKVHNDIAGPIFNTLGVIYAVLLGFVVVVVWEDFDHARMNVEMEASCLNSIYIDSGAFEKSFKQDVRSGVAAYAGATIDEWDALARGGHSLKADEALKNLVGLYSNYLPANETEKVFFTESVIRSNKLLDLRMLRLIDANEGVHPLLWFVLTAGGVITIIFTIFFGTDNLRAKIIMSALLAMSIAIVLFTVLEFSLPFTGFAKVSCESFRQLLVQLGL